jgi:hypothetical protein
MKFLSSLELKNICRLSDEPDLGNAVGSEIPGPGFSVKLRRARHLVCEERKGAVHFREVDGDSLEARRLPSFWGKPSDFREPKISTGYAQLIQCNCFFA